MARVLGFLLGELRGKLGGTVFSRNKSGAIVRAKVTPVNPQTVRQQTARYRFGNASILYQGLSSALKDCWQVFAGTHFNPLKGNNTGIYSGGNAFVALRQSTGQGNQYAPFVTGLDGNAVITFASSDYELVTHPPDRPTSSTVVASDGIAYPMRIVPITLNSQGELNIDIGFEGAPITNPPTINRFINAENQLMGLGFYMSNNLKFMGAKPNTALKLQFADSKVVSNLGTASGTVPVPIDGPFQMTLTNYPNPDNIRDFPCVGDIVLLTPFVRTSKGAMKLMTPSYITVT